MFVDGTGVGGGVVDTLATLGVRVYEVQFGSRADGLNPTAKYMNKRAEIWGEMRDWLKNGAIPGRVADRDLIEELSAPTYTITTKDQIQLESKEMMKRRGVSSPDFADALACTFAFPVAEDFAQIRSTPNSDYNPQALENLYAQ